MIWLPFLAIFAILGVNLFELMEAKMVVDSIPNWRLDTGNPQLDRFIPRVKELATRYLGDRANAGSIRAIIGIIRKESSGRGPPVVGDKTLSGGPSIGPMQVYRTTAKLFNFVPGGISAEDYAALASHEDECLNWGVQVFAASLRTDGRNPGHTLRVAIRLHNGSNSFDYEESVCEWLEGVYGSDWED
jgi:hypothetical protein